LKSSPSFPSFPQTGCDSALGGPVDTPKGASSVREQTSPASGSSGSSGNFLAGPVPKKRNLVQPDVKPSRDSDYKAAIDVLRRLKGAGAAVSWDGHQSHVAFDLGLEADQATLELYAKEAANIDAYLANEVPEFRPAERLQAGKLMRDLGVEVIVPSEPAHAAIAIAELIVLSGDFGLVLDVETAALPPWREGRPPLIIKRNGSLASKQPPFSPEAPLDPHRSRIRLIQLAGVHRPGCPNRVVVIDTDIVPATDAALLPVWRSKLWIHNAVFDMKHLIAAQVDLSHAEIVDTMLLVDRI
jgi:hypothetical protein